VAAAAAAAAAGPRRRPRRRSCSIGGAGLGFVPCRAVGRRRRGRRGGASFAATGVPDPGEDRSRTEKLLFDGSHKWASLKWTGGGLHWEGFIKRD
jgi:hypothetical protein